MNEGMESAGPGGNKRRGPTDHIAIDVVDQGIVRRSYEAGFALSDEVGDGVGARRIWNYP